VFRTIPQRIPTIEELEIPVEVKRFTEIRKGLVLITGPTGSGKSSTLAALVDIVNRERAAHIITVEDPIEFVHQNKMSTLTQREVGRDTDSFAEALRSATRQSPDLILVGEMRDRATINLALTLAEMGMLVFSTLHTNSAGRSVDRIIKVFPEDQQPQIRTMLAASIQGILSQILCRRADRAGRVPATELLFTSHAVQNVIREGATHKIESMLQAGRAQGMGHAPHGRLAVPPRRGGCHQPRGGVPKSRREGAFRDLHGLGVCPGGAVGEVAWAPGPGQSPTSSRQAATALRRMVAAFAVLFVPRHSTCPPTLRRPRVPSVRITARQPVLAQKPACPIATHPVAARIVRSAASASVASNAS